MKQRDVYLADLEPTRGKEQRGVRPVVIISGNTMNDRLGIFIVCPLTSKIKNYASCVVIKKNKENGLGVDSEVIPFQIRSLDRSRLIKRLGCISLSELGLIFENLADTLRY